MSIETARRPSRPGKAGRAARPGRTAPGWPPTSPGDQPGAPGNPSSKDSADDHHDGRRGRRPGGRPAPSPREGDVTCPQCGTREWDFTGPGRAQCASGHEWDQAPAWPGTFARPGFPGDTNDPERFPEEGSERASDPCAGTRPPRHPGRRAARRRVLAPGRRAPYPRGVTARATGCGSRPCPGRGPHACGARDSRPGIMVWPAGTSSISGSIGVTTGGLHDHGA